MTPSRPADHPRSSQPPSWLTGSPLLALLTNIGYMFGLFPALATHGSAHFSPCLPAECCHYWLVPLRAPAGHLAESLVSWLHPCRARRSRLSNPLMHCAHSCVPCGSPCLAHHSWPSFPARCWLLLARQPPAALRSAVTLHPLPPGLRPGLRARDSCRRAAPASGGAGPGTQR